MYLRNVSLGSCFGDEFIHSFCEFFICAIEKHVIAYVVELNSFLNEFNFPFFFDLSKEDNCGQLAWCLEDLALIETVVSKELEGSPPIRSLEFSVTVKSLFKATVFLG